VYERKFNSSADAQERAKYFFEFVVTPVVFHLDKIKETQVSIAEMQGLIQLERDAIIQRLGSEGLSLLKNLDEIDKRLEDWGGDLLDELNQIVD
jgi:hypothetical protein